MPPTAVHFNGSVNLPDAETVMREISSGIPNGVRRMTDGETGDECGMARADAADVPRLLALHSEILSSTRA